MAADFPRHGGRERAGGYHGRIHHPTTHQTKLCDVPDQTVGSAAPGPESEVVHVALVPRRRFQEPAVGPCECGCGGPCGGHVTVGFPLLTREQHVVPRILLHGGPIIERETRPLNEQQRCSVANVQAHSEAWLPRSGSMVPSLTPTQTQRRGHSREQGARWSPADRPPRSARQPGRNHI